MKFYKRTKTYITVLFCVLSVIFLTSCSSIEGLLTKIPFFEEADIGALTDKAQKAWDEVGKDALKDATTNAANTILGNTEEVKWPKNQFTENIPEFTSGKINKIISNDSLTEILIQEVSASAYDDYITLLDEKMTKSNNGNIYRSDNRLLSLTYDSNEGSLLITISIIKQNIEISEPESES